MTENKAPQGALPYSLFWLGWILAGIGVELWAVFRKGHGDTLSENVWRYVSGQRHPAAEPASALFAGRILVIGFLAWLAVHFGFGISLAVPGPLRGLSRLLRPVPGH